MTLHPMFALWHDYMIATGASPNTAVTRRRCVAAVASHAKVDVMSLTRDQVISVLARCRSPWTRLTYWHSLKAFDAWLVEFGHAELELLKGIKKPRSPRAAARPIDDATVSALLNARLPYRGRVYVRVALYQLLRVHEIAKIRGEDFDLASGWQLVRGKGGSVDQIPVHPEVAKIAADMPEFGFWFPSRTDPATHVSGTAVSLSIGAALRSVGSTATAHQLRDTAATRLQREGGNIRVTQRALRHHSIQSTMKYTAVADVDLKEAMTTVRW